MSTLIPKPAKQKEVPEDKSQEYLKEWKRLFNAIDPQSVHAFVKGEEDFPKQFQMHEGRLNDWYDTRAQLLIKVSSYFFDEYGEEIYCCFNDSAFAYGWIYTEDVNFDSLRREPITWKELYEELVSKASNHTKRIPIPPKAQN